MIVCFSRLFSLRDPTLPGRVDVQIKQLPTVHFRTCCCAGACAMSAAESAASGGDTSKSELVCTRGATQHPH